MCKDAARKERVEKENLNFCCLEITALLCVLIFAPTCLSRVENDVKLLRNRVRMLQMEHEKAQRKI